MRRVRDLAAFLYDFVVGDDVTIAVVVVLALAVTAELHAEGISAWWLLPCAAIGSLAVSLHRATRG